MKELTIEEKAKAYDEAIEKIQKYVKDEYGCTRLRPEDIFPELKDEDEMIRKALIKYFSEGMEYLSLIPYNKEQCVAWLEKQGEQKSIWHNEDEEPQRDSLILLVMQSGTPIVAKIIEPNHTFNHGERWAYIDDLLEKQVEPTDIPDDAVLDSNKDGLIADTIQSKPKFKVGDIITNGILVGKIDEIHELGYHAYFGDHYADVPDIENWHKWTIQDAKDGDVLAAHECYVIFKEIDGLNIKCYCTYHFMNNPSFYVDTLQNKLAFQPATKEQRAELEKAMADAGYTFDFEKKELKKIEQKPADIDNKFIRMRETKPKDISEFLDRLTTVEQEFLWEHIAKIRELDKEEQKPVKVPKFKAGDFIQFNGIGHTRYTVKEVCGLSHYINTCDKRMDMSYTDANFELVEHSAWSEEDEEHLNSIISDIKADMGAYPRSQEVIDIYNDEISFLKSLKDRYTWRPSEEQMEALLYEVNAWDEDSVNGQNLKSLYQDLKKLKN